SNLFIFFFSSRRRHTRSKRDWSSDVCSSDLSKEMHKMQQEFECDLLLNASTIFRRCSLVWPSANSESTKFEHIKSKICTLSVRIPRGWTKIGNNNNKMMQLEEATKDQSSRISHKLVCLFVWYVRHLQFCLAGVPIRVNSFLSR